MKLKNNFIMSKPLFIANVIVLCLIVLLLFFLIQYPMRYDNSIFRVLLAAIFIIIFFWKVFLIFICGISTAGLISVIKNLRNYSDNFALKISREIVFLTFGLSLSTVAGFIFSMGIKSGKPDIDPSLFFSYFNVLFIGYLVVRFGIGLLLYVRKAKP